MIKNYDNFSIQNENFDKICTFWNFHIHSIMNKTKHVLIEANLYFLITSCKRFHSQIPSYGKVKKTKKDSLSFYKVIPLVLINMLWPFSEISPLEKHYLDNLCMWGLMHMGMIFLWIMLSKDIKICWSLTYFWSIEPNQFTICKLNIHKP